MKKLIVFVVIFAICLSFVPSARAESFYSDTFNHWSSSDVNFASNELHVFKGYNDSTFRPDNNITRGEFITILVRVGLKLGLIEEKYQSTMKYIDMTNKQWSYTYVITYYEYMKDNFTSYRFEDIFPDSSFRPSKAITREEAMLLIGALLNSSIYDNDIHYDDVDEKYEFYKTIKSLCNLGILTGYEDNTLKLNKSITRGESASLVRRVYEYGMVYSTDYKSSLKYMNIEGQDVLPFFEKYDINTKNELEIKYIKAKNTLEYLAFGGYIFDEDKHLYDDNPIGTLKDLRENKFANIAGVNFYLLKYGNLTNNEKITYANEILKDISKRNDLKDDELIQLFNVVKDYNVTEAYFLKALSKWYSKTNDVAAILNIKMLRFEHFMEAKNYTYVKNLIYQDVSKDPMLQQIINLSWNTSTNAEISFWDFSGKTMYYSIYPIKDYSDEEDNKYYNRIIKLKDYVLVDDKDVTNTFVDTRYERLFYTYSLNKAYILDFIGQPQRAFIEAINEYKIVKKFDIYKTDKKQIDENYLGLLNLIKRKL